MISVTRLNHSKVVLNCDLIEYIETTPDTVISLTSGQKLMVLETSEEIVDSVVEFRRRIMTGDARLRVRPIGEELSPVQAGIDSHGR